MMYVQISIQKSSFVATAPLEALGFFCARCTCENTAIYRTGTILACENTTIYRTEATSPCENTAIYRTGATLALKMAARACPGAAGAL